VITSIAISSIDFNILVYVVGFLDPSTNDLISCTILLPNSNENPFIDYGLLTSTYSFHGLNNSKEGYGSTPSIYNPIACRPSCVYYCYCCKCCCKCCKCHGLVVVSIQSSYTSPLKWKYSSPSRTLCHVPFLTSWLCSLGCLSYGNVICGTFCLCSFFYFSCGNVICGTFVIYLVAYTTLALRVLLLALQMVPHCPSSFYVPLQLYFPIPSSLLSLRLLLPQLCYSF